MVCYATCYLPVKKHAATDGLTTWTHRLPVCFLMPSLEPLGQKERLLGFVAVPSGKSYATFSALKDLGVIPLQCLCRYTGHVGHRNHAAMLTVQQSTTFTRVISNLPAHP